MVPLSPVLSLQGRPRKQRVANWQRSTTVRHWIVAMFALTVSIAALGTASPATAATACFFPQENASTGCTTIGFLDPQVATGWKNANNTERPQTHVKTSIQQVGCVNDRSLYNGIIGQYSVHCSTLTTGQTFYSDYSCYVPMSGPCTSLPLIYRRNMGINFGTARVRVTWATIT